MQQRGRLLVEAADADVEHDLPVVGDADPRHLEAADLAEDHAVLDHHVGARRRAASRSSPSAPAGGSISTGRGAGATGTSDRPSTRHTCAGGRSSDARRARSPSAASTMRCTSGAPACERRARALGRARGRCRPARTPRRRCVVVEGGAARNGQRRVTSAVVEVVADEGARLRLVQAGVAGGVHRRRRWWTTSSCGGRRSDARSARRDRRCRRSSSCR